jgi:hypothetical protein
LAFLYRYLLKGAGNGSDKKATWEKFKAMIANALADLEGFVFREPNKSILRRRARASER